VFPTKKQVMIENSERKCDGYSAKRKRQADAGDDDDNNDQDVYVETEIDHDESHEAMVRAYVEYRNVLCDDDDHDDVDADDVICGSDSVELGMYNRRVYEEFVRKYQRKVAAGTWVVVYGGRCRTYEHAVGAVGHTVFLRRVGTVFLLTRMGDRVVADDETGNLRRPMRQRLSGVYPPFVVVSSSSSSSSPHASRGQDKTYTAQHGRRQASGAT